ncbi:hypothetical protein RJT34_11321 [Clitoria ternatea]|uniref:Uncharacterized protein n=1 Tax=Clitoria ternatea TaxID=43366 RepID=A0AAN9JJX4_CLITE
MCISFYFCLTFKISFDFGHFNDLTQLKPIGQIFKYFKSVRVRLAAGFLSQIVPHYFRNTLSNDIQMQNGSHMGLGINHVNHKFFGGIRSASIFRIGLLYSVHVVKSRVRN